MLAAISWVAVAVYTATMVVGWLALRRARGTIRTVATVEDAHAYRGMVRFQMLTTLLLIASLLVVLGLSILPLLAADWWSLVPLACTAAVDVLSRLVGVRETRKAVRSVPAQPPFFAYVDELNHIWLNKGWQILPPPPDGTVAAEQQRHPKPK